MRNRILILFLACVLCLAGCAAEGPPAAAQQDGTGWREQDGSTYYYFEDGTAATGWQEIDGKRYYFRSGGTLVTGWFSMEGQRYYLTAKGAAAGPLAIDGTVYLFDETGKLATGWTEVAGKRYWANLNSHPVSGWQEIDGVRVHFEEDFSQSIGWFESDGFRYYFLPDGAPAQGRVTIEGVSHTFAANGQEVILVNPWNKVPEGYTVELTDIGRDHQVASVAYQDYIAMMADCEAAGLVPIVCSSYRTLEYQQQLYARRIERYVEEGYSQEEATELAGRSVAIPGTSEHQLGLALDIIDNANWCLDETQAEMPTQQWLMAHSWEYGWILRYPEGSSEVTGIIYEPWHYRYVGREVAADIHASGLCLEEYLLSLTQSVG